jgi:hypothetical protein
MDRTQCLPGETVTHKMLLEGSCGMNEADLQAQACGSNSGCKGKCAVISICE